MLAILLYSALVLDLEMVVCFLEHYDIGFSPNYMQYSVVDLQSSESVALSTCQETSSFSSDLVDEDIRMKIDLDKKSGCCKKQKCGDGSHETIERKSKGKKGFKCAGSEQCFKSKAECKQNCPACQKSN